MNVYTFESNEMYSGGVLLIASNTLKESKILAQRNHDKNYARGEYECSGKIKSLTASGTKTRVLLDAIYIE